MSIYRTAVNNPVTTVLIFLAMVILGVYSLINISIDLLPHFDANIVMVMSSYPGASAEDIETNLTKLLENTLNGVSDLKNMTSNSKENICVIMMEFNEGVDIDVAMNDVRDKLDLVNSQLPDGSSVPVIFKFSSDDIPVMIYSASAVESLPGLEKILDDRVTTPLARIKGVGTVTVTGAPQREIQVYCDPNKLEAYNLTLDGISSTLAMENRNVPSGNIDIGTNTYTLRVEKEFKSAEEMLDVVVGYAGGSAVYLRDVARVVDGDEERAQEAYTDGMRSAQISIQKQTDANTVNVIRGLKKEMVNIQKSLPADIEIVPVIDGSRNIINSVNSLLETILITFLVVMIVVYIFLGRWRATFIIVTAIPISLLASLMYLFATGNTLNIVSMSALSIAIGMVVDDAIVVLENVSTHLERGAKPKEAAVHATQEVGISVIASTLTMLAVFLPLTMISGMVGIMFAQLGWIVSIIMIVSTCGALTLIPTLCSQFLRARPQTGFFQRIIFGNFNRFIQWLSGIYSSFIRICLAHRLIVVITAIVLFFVAIFALLPNIKTEYFPHQDEDRLTIEVTLPVGTAQEVTRQIANEMYEKFVERAPEIRVCTYTLGEADTDNVIASIQNNGTHIISYAIDIGSMEDRDRTSSQIADICRGVIAEYPDVKKATIAEGMGGMMGGASSVDLEIYGYDFDLTDALAEELKQKLIDRECCAEVTVSRDEYTPEYQVDFDRTKLAVNGLSSVTAASYLTAAMNGSVGSYFREDGEEYDIRVRYAPEFRTSVEDIENILVYNNYGNAIRMKDLGDIVEATTPPTIERKNRERVVTVSGVAADGYALSDLVSISQEILNETEIDPSLSVKIAGDYEDQMEMFSQLGILMVLIVILVYIVMASQFESFMSPFVIILSIPFGIVGVAIGLFVTGTPLGAMALIGVLILLGIVVKNGIVLIDYTILCRERGMNIVDAVATAARSRLRPILMTTLTTVLGMVPMAIGIGEGSEIWQPLGVTVAWGLSVSSLVTLVIIPTIYCSFSVSQEKSRKRRAEREAREEQEMLEAKANA